MPKSYKKTAKSSDVPSARTMLETLKKMLEQKGDTESVTYAILSSAIPLLYAAKRSRAGMSRKPKAAPPPDPEAELDQRIREAVADNPGADVSKVAKELGITTARVVAGMMPKKVRAA